MKGDEEIRPPSVERKFTAARHRAEFALSLLRQFGAPDPRFPFGVIRSIYLDSPRLRAYAEKVNGDYLKAKVRLRWYAGDGDPVPAFIELKQRLGAGRRKSRERVLLDRAWLESAPLSDPRVLSEIKTGAASLFSQVPADHMPMIDLEYRRHRFVCSLTGARVCLDTDIRVRRLNAHFFPSISLPVLPDIVFEIKDVVRGEVPWVGELAHAGFDSRSFSKYGECVRRTFEGGVPA